MAVGMPVVLRGRSQACTSESSSQAAQALLAGHPDSGAAEATAGAQPAGGGAAALKGGPASRSTKSLGEHWQGQDCASTAGEEDSTEDECNCEDIIEEEEEDEEERLEAVLWEDGKRQERRLHDDSNGAAEANAVPEANAERALQLQRLGQEGLVAALASVLGHLAGLGSKAHRATVFHASSTPQISIPDYLARLAKYFLCSDECLVMSLIYIDRLVKLDPDFVVSSLNIHRLLATSVMLAAKFHDDVFYSNKYYAKVAGVRLQEMNRLEESFLRLLKWQLYVLTDEYEEYLGRVLPPVRAGTARAARGRAP